MVQKNGKISGFSAPLSNRAQHALYGPPPWHFEGYSASVVFRFDPAEARELIPEPLALTGEPTCRLSLHDIVCDNGFGKKFAQQNPDQAHFHEAVLGFLVEHEDLIGQWCPFLWCSTDAEFAIGREFYGWPQKMGSMSLTRKPLDGWEVGDCVTALIARGQRAVFDMCIELENKGDIAPVGGAKAFPNQSKAGNYFTETSLPLPTKPMSVQRRIVATQMQNLRVSDIWSGSAKVNLHAPELKFLENSDILGGRWHELSWIKPFPDSIISERVIDLT